MKRYKGLVTSQEQKKVNEVKIFIVDSKNININGSQFEGKKHLFD